MTKKEMITEAVGMIIGLSAVLVLAVVVLAVF